jgi:hypothetical protein
VKIKKFFLEKKKKKHLKILLPGLYDEDGKKQIQFTFFNARLFHEYKATLEIWNKSYKKKKIHDDGCESHIANPDGYFMHQQHGVRIFDVLKSRRSTLSFLLPHPDHSLLYTMTTTNEFGKKNGSQFFAAVRMPKKLH